MLLLYSELLSFFNQATFADRTGKTLEISPGVWVLDVLVDFLDCIMKNSIKKHILFRTSSDVKKFTSY